MHRISRIERRSLLTGWIKWALLPMLPFSVIFFDAWLNVQVRYKDYELGRLNDARRELNAELDMTRAKEASLSGIEHLTEMAAQMQLASPTPQQFRTIAYHEAPRRIPVMDLAHTTPPTTPPLVISLEDASKATLAKNVSGQGVEKGRAPVLTAAPQNENYMTSFYGNSTPYIYGEVLAAQPYAPTQDIYEDPELSLLTVEDMLGKL